MKTLDEVRKQLSAGEFEFSRHAFKRVVERSIADQEIRDAGAQAGVIEDYPDDKYSHRCLLLGFTQNRRPLHIQVSLAETTLVKIITIYEPDANELVDYTTRR